MADNFDLRQFLTENKLTKNAKLLSEAVTLDGKPVDVSSIEIDDIDTADYPDFSDAYIAYAEFEDGTPLTEEELIKLEEENYGIVGELIFDRQLYMEGKSKQAMQEEAEGDGWKYFDIDGDEVEGLYMDTVDGVKIYSMTDSSVADTVSYVLEDPDGYVETIHIDVSGQPVSSEDIENEHEVVSYIADFIADDINSELGLNEAFDHDAPQGDSYEEVVAWLDDKYPDASQYDEFVAAFEKELRNLPQDKKSQWTAKFKKDYGSLDEWTPYGSIAFYGNDKPKEREPKEGEVELSTLNKGDVFKLADGKGIEFRVWGDDPRGGVYVQYTNYDEPRPNYTMRDTTKVIKLDGEVSEAKSYKVSKNSKEAQHLKKGDIIGSGDEVVSVSAGAKTPSGKIEVTLKTKDGKTKTSTWGKTTKIGVKEKETVKENTMTERDKYLTRLVENALGLEITEDDNVDYTMGRHDDPDQLPNPPAQLNIPEGEEMAQETVIPEYKTIEELMKNIDHGTNKVAEEHKMQEMKKIAEALRMKAKKMEESEHAQHINPKDLKQLAKDAAALEKAAEKLKAAFDKKFNKKEKAPAAKAEKVEALQEGTFDLRNFLVENKLTSNSKMLNEAQSARAYALIIDEDGNFIKEDLSNYSEESYLDPEGEKLSGMEEVLNYPETVSAWQHAPELKDSQDAEWKQAVAELGNSYMYYDVIGDGGENAVIAAIPQGSSLTDYIQDDF